MLRQFLGPAPRLQQVKVGLERIGDPQIMDPLAKSQLIVGLQLVNAKIPAVPDGPCLDSV
jgi:hypothetical protein